ncbi:MAG: uridylate kinase [Eubacteriales bacterium]
MANFDFDVVVKIGSMALIRQEDNDLDYNIFSRLASELKPGYALISSGATEIGRLDYMKRNGQRELKGDMDEIKADYAAQGQAILMQNYRKFINPKYSVRQVLVEHAHFNDEEKKEHIKKLLFRAANQNAIPIINYNDPVCSEENRRMEIAALRNKKENIVECVDNDETAAIITKILNARLLVLLTSVDGIFKDKDDPNTLIPEIIAESYEKLEKKVDEIITYCNGSSRKMAGGAAAKLKFAMIPIDSGTTVIIANAKYHLNDIIKGIVPRTLISIEK